MFLIGDTTVQCSAVDAAGFEGTESFTVTVNAPPRQGGTTLPDNTPPRIIVPQAITIDATSSDGAVVTYTVRAEDDVDGTATLTQDENSISLSQDDVGGDIAISCFPASGSMFLIGDTTVQCSAVDAAGFEGTESFTVTVNAPSDNIAGAGSFNTGDNNLQAQSGQVTGTSPVPIANMFPLIVVASIVVIGGIALAKYSKNRNRGRKIKIPPSAVVDIHTKGGTRE
jgi:hypothetical protein